MTTSPRGARAPRGFTGAIFDVDGVLVDSPHERAWSDALGQMMEGPWLDIRDRTTWNPDGFTPQVYAELVSGKPRIDGARAVLDHFGVPATESRVEAYAARKQSMVIALIEAGRFAAYPDALRFALAVRATGIRLATASSSTNAELLLRKIRVDSFAEEEGRAYDFVRPGMSLLALVDADVSAAELSRGKPHPGIFLRAAAKLGVPADRCIVVEDAVSGIRAACRAGMGALAVARAGDAQMLADAGADLVVTSLDEVDVGGLAEGRLLRRDG